MFIEFFYLLRKRGHPSFPSPSGSTEALFKGFMESSLDHLYYVGHFLVKSEAYYDMYDLAFQDIRGSRDESRGTGQVLEIARKPDQRDIAPPELRGDGRAGEATRRNRAEV